jgi:integrase
MRLSEAAGLIKDDVSLEHEHSHIIFKVHPWRRLKTKGSDRIVPLAGEALKYSRGQGVPKDYKTFD